MFLSSELQAAQIVRNRRVTEKQEEGSPVCRELLSIFTMLNIPEPRGVKTAGVFSQVKDRVGLIDHLYKIATNPFKKLQLCHRHPSYHLGVIFGNLPVCFRSVKYLKIYQTAQSGSRC